MCSRGNTDMMHISSGLGSLIVMTIISRAGGVLGISRLVRSAINAFAEQGRGFARGHKKVHNDHCAIDDHLAWLVVALELRLRWWMQLRYVYNYKHSHCSNTMGVLIVHIDMLQRRGACPSI